MSCYPTMQDVKDVSSLPASDIDNLESLYSNPLLSEPSFFRRVATFVSAEFDSRLMKRYLAPFVDPVPDVLRLMTARVVGYRLLLKRGFNPNSAQDQLVVDEKNEAIGWLKEAADSKDGCVELPARQTSSPHATAVDVGGPLGYSEGSDPYTWVDLQSETRGMIFR